MTYTRPLIRRLDKLVRAVLRVVGLLGRTGSRPIILHGKKPRILLVKLAGMGDAVLVRSLAEHYHAMHPEFEIGVLAGPATQEVLHVNSNYFLHLYDPAGSDQGVLRAFRKVCEVRRREYDVVIDFEQHYALVALLLWLTGIPYRVGLSAAENGRSCFQTHTVPLSGSDAMWSAYIALMRIVEPSLGNISTVSLPCSEKVINDVEQWWKTNHLDAHWQVVALHLGCGSRAFARRWPVQRFVELARRLTDCGQADAIVLTGTSEENVLVEEFRASFRGNTVDATNLGSVERTAALLRRCHLVISNDTGLMHLAAAMGRPTVGLFGPNTPGRYAPVGSHAAAVYATKIPCSPCIHIHQGIVPECFDQVEGRCLLDIDVETVLTAALEVIESPPMQLGTLCGKLAI